MFGGTDATDMLWRSGLAAVPLVLVVAGICRCIPCRPWTRHALWVTVLALMVLLLGAPLLPRIDAAALGSLIPKIEIKGTGPTTFGPAPAGDIVPPAPDRVTPAAPAGAPQVAERSPEPVKVRTDQAVAAAPGQARDARTSEQAASPSAMVAAAPAAARSQVWAPLVERPVTATRSAAAPTPRTKPPDTGATVDPWMPRIAAPPPLAVIKDLGQEVAVPVETTKAVPAETHLPTSPASSAPAEKRLAATGVSGPGPGLVAVRENLMRVLRAAVLTGAQWQNGLVALRNDLVALPSVPPELWLVGAVTIGMVGGLQIVRCRRLIKRARPAPDSVTLLVRGAARTLGLRRVPEVLMVDDRVSPMVWCAVQPRLVLPAPLWAELDLIGRSAVIHHELAHLKRRDHWVCWLEMLVGLVYWWHPLAWFVRRRVREEADLCCDAWVTTLFPRDRRAYAQALLETRKYVSGAGLGAPTLGLTVMSSGAKRFARRLTMVMTQRVRPGRSLAGTVLSLALAAGALVTSPLWACPPEKDKEQAQATVRTTVATQAQTATKSRITGRAGAPRAPKATTVDPVLAWPTPPTPSAPPAPPAAFAAVAPEPPVAPAPPPAGAAWRVYSVPGVAPTPETGASTFERHMAARTPSGMAPQPAQPAGSSLDRIERRLDELSRRLDEFSRRLDGETVRERRPAAPRSADPFRQPRSDAGTMLYKDALAQMETTPGASISGPCVIAVDPSGNVKIWRLQNGSLESVAELMGKSNAPLVYDGRSHAALSLGQAFKADKMKSQALLEGQLAGGRVKVVSPEAIKELRETQAMQRDKERKAYGEAMKSRGEALRSGAEAQRRAAEQLRKRAEEIRARAHEVNRHADQMREEADHVRQKSDEAAGGERDELLSKAETLTTEAESVREQAEALTEQAEALSEQVDEITESISSLEDENASVDEPDAVAEDIAGEVADTEPADCANAAEAADAAEAATMVIDTGKEINAEESTETTETEAAPAPTPTVD